MTQIEKTYGGKRRNAVNRAIRAECAGGDGLLDGMKILDNLLLTDLPDDLRQRCTLLMSALNVARDAMGDDVLARDQPCDNK